METITKFRRTHEPVERYKGRYEAKLWFRTGVIRVAPIFAGRVHEIGYKNAIIVPTKEVILGGDSPPYDSENYRLLIWKGKKKLKIICKGKEYLDLVESRLTKLPKDHSLSMMCLRGII